MKQKLMILSVFAIGMFVWSCGDDPKDDLPGPIKDSKNYTYGITAPTGATIILDRTLTVSDFTGISLYKDNVYKGSLGTDSYFEFIKGSSENIELKDVTFQIKNNPKITYSLGTINADHKFNSLADLNFLQLVVNEMIANKETVLQLSYISTEAITKEAKLNLKLDITFSFK